MLSTNRIEKTYTVEDFIELGKLADDFQFSKFAILSNPAASLKNPLWYPEHNVIFDYNEEFKKLALTVEMTNEEHHKYKYKPKLLAFDVYGSTELYFAILYINGIYSIKDFDRKEIKLLTKKDMIGLLEAIYNAEQNYIELNRAKIGYIE